ncbi:MAG: NapC/NirT family cytochrome c [Proteobacteria bacterium]|nr:NapC/NirT family cytochrome c [Pseudomonadota bacterium]
MPWSSTALLSASFVAGIVFWGGLNWSIEMTNTESFCISCHEMEQNVFREYRKTVHYLNRTGVRATCPDCHVPREWGHKLIRKVRATNELYHWIRGSIDSREKFQAKRYELASHVWDSMRATDSRECRNCHGNDYMARAKQSPMARKSHELGIAWGNTCIECHQGIAHELPEEFDKEVLIDQMHDRMEQQDIDCHECHDELYKPAANDEW